VTLDLGQLIGLLIVVCAVGAFLGQKLEARRWRRNAGDFRRIESAGKLFKVEEAL
jgi:hypothetical protein